MDHYQFIHILAYIITIVDVTHKIKNNVYPFQTLVNIICHQQVSNNTANNIYNNIVEMCGAQNTVTHHKFKQNIIENAVNKTELIEIGLTNDRINTIGRIINTLGRMPANKQNIIKILLQYHIHDIGTWTIDNFEIDENINENLFPDNDTAVNGVIRNKFNMNVHAFIAMLNDNDISNIGEVFLYLQHYADLQH